MAEIVEIQAMIYNAEETGGYVQNFKSIRQKIRIFIFGVLGGGGLGCGQNQIFTDPRNGLKNPNMNFSNDQFHRLGRV